MSMDAAAIMTRHTISVRPGDDVGRIAHALADNGLGAVPVCHDDGRLVGIVSEGDLLRPFTRDAVAKRTRWIEQLAEGTEISEAFLRHILADHRRACDLMSTPVITVAPDTPMAEVVSVMLKHRIKHVPVVEGGKVTGMIARADIVGMLARDLAAFAPA